MKYGRLWLSVGLMCLLFVNYLPLQSQTSDSLLQLSEQGDVRVIVELVAPFQPVHRLNAVEQASQLSLLTQTRNNLVQTVTADQGRAEVLSTEWNAPLIALEVNATALEALQRSPQVKSIRLDRLNVAFLAESTAFIDAPVVWASGGTGAGTSIVIIDTGVDATHPFFGGRVVREACFSSAGTSLCRDGRVIDVGGGASAAPYAPCDPTNPKPLCNHGTHVAGIAAGNGDAFDGVARDANIIAMQVFHLNNNPDVCGSETPPCLRASDIDILNALSHVYDLTQTEPSLNIASVNMSLGSSLLYDVACDDLSNNPDDPAGYTELVAQLKSAGVVTVAAAGNSGTAGRLASPACVSNVISAGALDISDPQNPVIANYSNWASAIDFVAPGSDIESSVPGNTFAELSGTSMAAPHVAAAMAIVRGQNPTYTSDEVIQTVRLSSRYVLSPDGSNQSLPSLSFQTNINCIFSQQALINVIAYANSFPSEVTRTTLCSDITLTSLLPEIIGKVYINGNTYTIFDNANNGQRSTFRVTSTGHFSIEKLTLSGGITRGIAGGGSAIVNQGFLMILNSNFENNVLASCEPSSGLQECQGQSGQRVNSGGGSALANSGLMVLVNSTFDANMNWAAFGGGGAIYNSPTGNIISINTVCRDTNYAANQGQCILNQGNIQSVADVFEHTDDAIADWSGVLSFGSGADVSLAGLNTQCFSAGTAVRRFSGGFTSDTETNDDRSILYQSVEAERDIALSVYDEDGNEIYCNDGAAVRRFSGGFENDEFVIDIPALDDTRRYTIVIWDVTPYATVTNTGLATGFIDPLTATEDVEEAITYSVNAEQIQNINLTQPVLNNVMPSSDGNIVTWVDNETTETTYLVERTMQSNTGWQLIATLPVNSTTYTDTSVLSGTTYTYRVRAYKFGATTPDDQISQPSNTITVNTVDCNVCTPVRFQADNVTDSTVEFSWSDNSIQESSFSIQRYNESTLTWDTIDSVNMNTTTFTDGTVTCETLYDYRISANGSSSALESNVIDVFTGPCPPMINSIRNQGDGSAILRWEDLATTETRYLIEKSLDGGQTWSQVATLLPNTTFFIDNTITCDVYHRLVAERDDRYGSGLQKTRVVVDFPSLCDINRDGIISPADAIQIVNSLGQDNSSLDVNGDGLIDTLDLQQVLDNLGE